MKELSKSELEIMNILWKIKKGFMKDVVNEYGDPKPAYTTISTLISRMVAKGYVAFNKIGREKEYFPKVTKKSYFSNHFKGLLSQYFDNSASQLMSYFAKSNQLSVEELKELQKIINEQIDKKK